MKYALVALIAGASASSVHQQKLFDMMALQTESEGAPIHMDGNTWRRPWP